MYRCPILYGGSASEVFGNHVRSSDFIGLARETLLVRMWMDLGLKEINQKTRLVGNSADCCMKMQQSLSGYRFFISCFFKKIWNT